MGACSRPPRPRAPARVATCRLGPLSDSAVAGLPVGAAVSSVKEHCRVLVDTTWPGEEALPEHVLLVQIGSDTLVAVIDSDRVWRIEVASPQFRTRDSLGVGSRLSALLRNSGAQALNGEGSYYVRVRSHCGLSFQLPYIAFPNDGDLDEAALRALPDTLRVQEVLVFGCDYRRRHLTTLEAGGPPPDRVSNRVNLGVASRRQSLTRVRKLLRKQRPAPTSAGRCRLRG